MVETTCRCCACLMQMRNKSGLKKSCNKLIRLNDAIAGADKHEKDILLIVIDPIMAISSL